MVEFLTTQQAADRLGVNIQTFRAYVRRGEITPYTIRSSRLARFKASDVDAMFIRKAER